MAAGILAVALTGTASANVVTIDFDEVYIRKGLDGDATTCGDFATSSYRVASAKAGSPHPSLESGQTNLLIPAATLVHDLNGTYWRQCDWTTYSLLNTVEKDPELFVAEWKPGGFVEWCILKSCKETAWAYTHDANQGASRLRFSATPGTYRMVWASGVELDGNGYDGSGYDGFNGMTAVEIPSPGKSSTFTLGVSNHVAGADVAATLTAKISTAAN